MNAVPIDGSISQGFSPPCVQAGASTSSSWLSLNCCSCSLTRLCRQARVAQSRQRVLPVPVGDSKMALVPWIWSINYSRSSVNVATMMRGLKGKGLGMNLLRLRNCRATQSNTKILI